jgi:hypothetical protein
MTIQKNILPWLLCFTICACSITKEEEGIRIAKKSNTFITPNGHTIAKHVKFTLKDQFTLTDTALLSTSYLYKKHCYPEFWFKFYNDGKVVYGNQDKELFKNFNTLVGWAGYYRIIDNKINIEISYTQSLNDWGNLHVDGEIVGDTLKFYKDPYGGERKNIHHFTSTTPSKACHYFIRSKETALLMKPDW